MVGAAVNYIAGALAIIILGLGIALYQQHSSLEQCNSDFTAYKAAQAQAVKDQSDKVKEAQRLQAAAEAAAKVAREQGLKDAQPLVDSLTARVRQLQAAIHNSAMPGAVAHSSGGQGGSAGAGEAQGSGPADGDLAAAVKAATSACLRTYADWQAIVSLEPKP